MTRHRILNPATGRKVFKTGVLGRKIQKKTRTKSKKLNQIPKEPKGNKCKGGVCKPVERAPKKKKKESTPKKRNLVPGKWYRDILVRLRRLHM
jgi:hypothetical protein